MAENNLVKRYNDYELKCAIPWCKQKATSRQRIKWLLDFIIVTNKNAA